GIGQGQGINHAEIRGSGVGRDAKLFSRVVIIFAGEVSDAEGGVKNCSHLALHLLKVGVGSIVLLGELRQTIESLLAILLGLGEQLGCIGGAALGLEPLKIGQ